MQAKLAIILSASAIMQSTGLSQNSATLAVMPSNTVNSIADAIFRAEGGSKTKHPYGIMGIYTIDPRHVCFNTINHAWKDFEGEQKVVVLGKQSHTNDVSLTYETKHTVIGLSSPVTLPFIQFLGSRYCPPSVDPRGYRAWTNNVWKIYSVNKNKP